MKNLEMKIKKVTVLELSMKLGRQGPKLRARMAGLHDRIDSLSFLQLCHTERMLNHAFILIQLGMDLFEFERKDR